jgi:hypothetical protein
MLSTRPTSPFVAPSPLIEPRRAEYIVTRETQRSSRSLSNIRRKDMLPSPHLPYTDSSLHIPSESAGYVLGKKGRSIKRVQYSTNTSIRVLVADNYPSCPVRINGVYESIQEAKHHINILVGQSHELFPLQPTDANRKEQKVGVVPNDKTAIRIRLVQLPEAEVQVHRYQRRPIRFNITKTKALISFAKHIKHPKRQHALQPL